MCYGYDEESDTYDNEPWYIRVKSVSDTKLIIKLLNDDNQTVDDTRRLRKTIATITCKVKVNLSIILFKVGEVASNKSK